MGIKGLSQVIGDYAPNALKQGDIKNYFGRKVAIDASMCIYQFLIAVRQEGNMLTNEDGETTSHLMGIFYRTIRMVENGIKPVYVFDGKPPNLKSGELEKRKERREEAQKALQKAEEEGEEENVEKFSKRLVKVTKEHNVECQQLLDLMGIPYVCAPCEAEAECADLVKAGKVFATGTEDMDALTFGSNVLLRHLTFSEARKMGIKEFSLERVLSGLNLSMEQFIDLCILLGCDYCDSIRGIGPKRAVELIKTHKSIEEIIKHLDTKKYSIPNDWPFEAARNLFKNPEVSKKEEISLMWTEPKVEELVKFMVESKGFNEERIRNGVKKLQKARSGSTQGRMDSFFKSTGIKSTTTKRKIDDVKGKAKKPKGFKKGK